MDNKNFVHLHRHDSSSLLDGLYNPEKYAKYASEIGFKYLAVTNHGSIDSLIQHQKACEKYGLIPIIGIEGYIVENVEIKEKGIKNRHIIYLVKNEIGYKNLLDICNYGQLIGHYYRPRIDAKFLLDHCEGLIISTACISSFIVESWGIQLFNNLHDKIDDDLYLEVMSHNTQEQIIHNQLVMELHNKTGVDIIATNDCHYLEKDDHLLHEVLLAVNSKKKWNDPDRRKVDSNYEMWMKSADEILESFDRQGLFSRKQVIQFIRNTMKVAKKCENFRIKKQDICLPMVPGLEDKDENEYLKELCVRGSIKKIGEFLPIEYENRLNHELETIKKKGLSKYFLIVWELINWCRDNNILPGPGRGSAGASLVTNLLDITNIDPILYNLPFSRFLDEERDDAVDIDQDLPDHQRHLVIKHLKELYGEHNISAISIFQTMKSRGVIRDVSRVFDVPLKEVDEFAKIIDDKSKTAILDALENDIGKHFQEKYPDIIKYALKLEGQNRNIGCHASGYILSKNDLRYSGQCHLKSNKGEIATNWDLSDCEYNGLMKLDLLGLSTLSIMSEAKRLTKQNHNIDIDYYSLPLDDEKVFKELSLGNTVGVFQMNTYAMTTLIKDMGIEKFSHMVDAVALVRPGSRDAGLTDLYIKRKHGEEWVKKHPIYEEITKDTYGTYCFQEQIMNIINKIAGLSMSTANKIRKIIGKKRDASEFEQYKNMFVEGCLKQKTFSYEEAIEFWDNLQYAASYLFNKAHSVGYAMLSYYTAWMKIYYPAEFLCACLTYGSKDNKMDFIKEAKRYGLSVELPKYGISHKDKWNVKDNRLYCPLIEIKGVGDKAAEKIYNEYSSKVGFLSLPEKSVIKGKLKETLEKIGLFSLDFVPDSETQEYFEFDVGIPINQKYPKLVKIFNDNILQNHSEDVILNGQFKGTKLVKLQPKLRRDRKLLECNECELREQCKKPVLPSVSEYNMMIISEFPNIGDDHKGQILTSKASDILWSELKRYNLEKDMFHVTAATKCFPNTLKRPSLDNIEKCRHWIEYELEKVNPVLVLSIGNISRYLFTNEESGIIKVNATTRWHEKYGCFVTYCITPGSTYKNNDNLDLFRNAIREFSRVIEDVGGI